MVLRWNVTEKRREVGEAQCVGKQGASEQPVRISWMGWLAGPALSQKISRYSACPLKKFSCYSTSQQKSPIRTGRTKHGLMIAIKVRLRLVREKI